MRTLNEWMTERVGKAGGPDPLCDPAVVGPESRAK